MLNQTQYMNNSQLTSLSSMPSLLTVLATSDKSKPILTTESTYLWESLDKELYMLHRDVDMSTGGVVADEHKL